MSYHRFILALCGVSMFVICGQWPGQAAAAVNVDVGGVHVHVGGAPPPPDGVVVLTRGPVHEAFAQPIAFDEQAAVTITHRPPAPIDEIIPDQRPEGNNIVWIPGYWSWDTDRNDFIWVSGCWRAAPPNTSWVPGYWAQTRGGYQWIGGFWTTVDAQEIEYLPAPPATLEAGPQGTGSPDSIWVPGCWVWQDGRYAWRQGFWEAGRANWVWVPSHYTSTPRGWAYVDGYWDYPLERRGVAFLPVYAPPSLYGRAGFQYSPDVALDLAALSLNLFISPGHRHYCFGDYYGTEYSREGYRPWYEVREHHDWYDPIFVHEQWRHRDDHQWVEHQREGYDHRRDDKALRPARTYDDMKAQVARMPEKDRNQAQLGRPMKDVVAAKTTPFKFAPVDAKTREATASQAKDVHAYAGKRSQWETPTGSTAIPEPAKITPPKGVVTPEPGKGAPPKELPKPPAKEVAPMEKPQTPDHGVVVNEKPGQLDTQSHKVTIPKSPLGAREPVHDKEMMAPPRPEHPKADTSVQPKTVPPVVPDHSKDVDSSDKGKPELPKK